MPECDI